jgi:carbonic anhydrase
VYPPVQACLPRDAGKLGYTIITTKQERFVRAILERLRKDVSFFIKPILKQKLEAIPENTNLIIDLVHAEHLDRDVIDTINEFIQHAPLKNINCIIKKNEHNKLHQLLTSN